MKRAKVQKVKLRTFTPRKPKKSDENDNSVKQTCPSNEGEHP